MAFAPPASDEAVAQGFTPPPHDDPVDAGTSLDLPPLPQGNLTAPVGSPGGLGYQDAAKMGTELSIAADPNVRKILTENPDMTDDQKNQFANYLKDTQEQQLPTPGVVGQLGEAVSSGPLVDAMQKKSEEDVQKANNDEQMRQLMKAHGVDDATIAATVPQPGVGEQIMKGSAQAIGGMASFFTTPTGLATLGIGELPAGVQRAASLTFAAQMASQTPDIAASLLDELNKLADQRNWQKITELTASGLMNTGFAGFAAAHGFTPESYYKNKALSGAAAGLLDSSVLNAPDANRAGLEQTIPSGAAVVPEGATPPKYASKVTSGEGMDLQQQGAGVGQGAPLRQSGQTSGTPPSQEEAAGVPQTIIQNATLTPNDDGSHTVALKGDDGVTRTTRVNFVRGDEIADLAPGLTASQAHDLTINGFYLDPERGMVINTDAENPGASFTHEMIHAMRGLGLISDTDMQHLIGEHLSDKIIDDVKNSSIYNNLSHGELNEEYLARIFEQLHRTGDMPERTRPIYQKVWSFVKNLFGMGAKAAKERVLAGGKFAEGNARGGAGAKFSGEHGGAQEDLPEEQRKISEKNNAPDAWAEMRAQVEAMKKAKQTPKVEASNGTLTDKALFSITAHHGTPHEVDKFDTSKIGSGEGAQVYGHGLYFAENPKVAETYAEQLGRGAYPTLDKLKTYFTPGRVIPSYGGGYDRVVKFVHDADNKHWHVEVKPVRRDESGRFIETHEPSRVHTTAPGAREMERSGINTSGNKYTVKLNAKPEEMLDWDKRFSEQSDYVKAALKPYVDDTVKNTGNPNAVDKLFGQTLYQFGMPFDERVKIGRQPTPEEMSNYLLSRGIKGIRYLDQGSRVYEPFEQNGKWYVADEGKKTPGAHAFQTKSEAEDFADTKRTRNYVVFDGKDVAITHKNGEEINAEQAMKQPKFSVTKQQAKTLKDDPRTAIDVLQNEAVNNPIRPKQNVDFDLTGEDGVAGSTGFSRVFAVADYLSRRATELGGGKLSELSSKNAEEVAKTVANEAEYAVKRDPAAIGWYGREVRSAMKQIYARHPELEASKPLQSVFKAILAITSNGQDVYSNFAQADKLYNAWKRTGTIPEDEVWGGKSMNAINDGLKTLNILAKRLGTENLHKFLAQKFKVSELRDAGFDPGGESADHVTHGSGVFGPKVGGGFYQNLIGNLDPITMDMWLMRTINRMRGTLTEPNQSALPGQIDRFVKALRKEPGAADLAKDGERIKRAIADGSFDADAEKDKPGSLVSLAKQVWTDFKNSGYKNRTEARRAAKNIAEEFYGINEAPSGPPERDFIRKIWDSAQQKLQKKGVNISNADLQAVLWYLEKDIYGKLGATNRRSESASYSDAAAALNRKQLGLFDEEQRGAAGVRGTQPVAEPGSGLGEAGRQLSGRAALKQLAEQPKFSVTRNEKFYRDKPFADVSHEVNAERPPIPPLAPTDFKSARNSLHNLIAGLRQTTARGNKINFANRDENTAAKIGLRPDDLMARAIHAISNRDRKSANPNKVVLAPNTENTIKRADFVLKMPRDTFDEAGDSSHYGKAYVKLYDMGNGEQRWHLAETDGNGNFITQYSWPRDEEENGRVMKARVEQVGQRAGGITVPSGPAVSVRPGDMPTSGVSPSPSLEATTPKERQLPTAGNADLKNITTSAGVGQESFLEVAPDPNNKELTARWNNLPYEARQSISRDIANNILPKVLARSGAQANIAHDIGYFGGVNPNIRLEFHPQTTFEKAREATVNAGYVMRQQAVIVADERITTGPTTKFIWVKPDEAMSPDDAKVFMEMLGESGSRMADGSFAYANFTGKSDADFYADLVKKLDDSPVSTSHEFREFRSDYIDNLEKEANLYRDANKTGQNEQADVRGTGNGIDSLKAEFASDFDKAVPKLASEEPGSGDGERPVRFSAERRTQQGNPRKLVPGEKDDGFVALNHWSNVRRDTIDPNRFGSNFSGAEKTRKRDYGRDFINRAYYGLKGYKAESGIGSEKHTVEIPAANLYDINDDPDNLLEKARPKSDKKYGPFDARGRATVYEREIHDAGYAGYYNRDHKIAAVFRALPGEGRVQFSADQNVPADEPDHVHKFYAGDSPEQLTRHYDYSPENLEKYKQLDAATKNPQSVEEITSPQYQLASAQKEQLKHLYNGNPPRQLLTPKFSVGGDIKREAVRELMALDGLRKGLIWRMNNSRQLDTIAKTKDAANNAASRFANETGNDLENGIRRATGRQVRATMRPRLPNEIAGWIFNAHDPLKKDNNALTFIRESGVDKAEMQDYKQRIENALKNPPASLTGRLEKAAWRSSANEALEAINHGIENFDKIAPVAIEYGRRTKSQWQMENDSGMEVPYHENYVLHAQDVDGDFDLGAWNGGSHGSENVRFKKERSYRNYVESLEAGVLPKSLDAIGLMKQRINLGQRMINNRAWIDSLNNLHDAQGDPLAKKLDQSRTEKPVTNMKTVMQPNGTIRVTPIADPGYHIEYKQQGNRRVAVQVRYQRNAPYGYDQVTFGGQDFAVKKGFSNYFNALTEPSIFSKNAVGRAVMQGWGLAKHIMLAADTFHLGRLGAWASIIQGRPAEFQKSLVLLDHSEEEIRKMASLGEIPKNYVDDLIERRRLMNEFISRGYNIGGQVDNFYNDWVSHLPITGVFNKWLFQNFQRGAMMEAALHEFNRLRPLYGSLTDTELVDKISKDLNTRFGALGSQGVFKSRTMQDMARLFILAPQWNEGLIRSELGSVFKSIPGSIHDSVTNRRIIVSSMAKAMLTMTVAQLAGNQIINYITRGHSTFENPESNWEAKISAFVPDATGTSPGYIISPITLPFETTHLLVNYLERTGNAHDAVREYLASRFGPGMRTAYTALAKRDQFDRAIPPDKYWGAVGKAAIPVPISGSAAVNFLKDEISKALNPNYTGSRQQFPGQYQRQLMATFGIKSQTLPDEIARTAKLANDYNVAHNVPRSAEFSESDYAPLKNFLKIGNVVDAADQMNRLLRDHTATQIYDSLKKGATYPFTANKERELDFYKSLSPAQQQDYHDAIAKKDAISLAGRELLATVDGTPSIKWSVGPANQKINFLLTPEQKLNYDEDVSKTFKTAMSSISQSPNWNTLPVKEQQKISNYVAAQIRSAKNVQFVKDNWNQLEREK